MTYNEELVHLKMIETLLEQLPKQLELQSEEPVRFLQRETFGEMTFREELIALPALQELWTEQHVALNYPAIILLYRDTLNAPVSECDDVDVTMLFQADLILTHHEPEALQFLWYRYANAIKAALSQAKITGKIFSTGQRITETGPLESVYLRRGLIDFQVSF